MVNFTNKCLITIIKELWLLIINTFHFYRLNKDGTWSHKPGITKVKTTVHQKQQQYHIQLIEITKGLVAH